MKILNMTKEQTIIVVAISVILLLSTGFFRYNIYLENIYKAKIELAQQETDEALARAAKKSDIEMLEFYAAENASSAKKRLEDIVYHKAEVEKLEDLYESDILSQRCYEGQIERKINSLEYNMKYCTDENNLEQYRSKKD